MIWIQFQGASCFKCTLLGILDAFVKCNYNSLLLQKTLLHSALLDTTEVREEKENRLALLSLCTSLCTPFHIAPRTAPTYPEYQNDLYVLLKRRDKVRRMLTLRWPLAPAAGGCAWTTGSDHSISCYLPIVNAFNVLQKAFSKLK